MTLQFDVHRRLLCIITRDINMLPLKRQIVELEVIWKMTPKFAQWKGPPSEQSKSESQTPWGDVRTTVDA